MFFPLVPTRIIMAEDMSWDDMAGDWDNFPGVKDASKAFSDAIEAQSWWTGEIGPALDFGGGSGLMAFNLLNSSKAKLTSIVVADLAPKMIAIVDKKKAAAPAEIASRISSMVLKSPDAAELTGLAGSYQLVTAGFVFHHVEAEHREIVTRRVVESARPGGYVAVAEFDGKEAGAILDLVKKAGLTDIVTAHGSIGSGKETHPCVFWLGCRPSASK